MPFEPGRAKTGGRVAGTPNKTTSEAQEAIATFVEFNLSKLQKWLDEIHAEEGAQAAFDSFSKLVEYHVPKKARVEHTGKDGGDINVNIVRFGNNPTSE
jgi:hypothetical protein